MKNSNPMKLRNILNFVNKNAFWAITLTLLLTAINSQAQTTGDGTGTMIFVVYMVAIVSVIVLLVAIYALQVVKKLERNQPATEGEQDKTFWQRFLELVNDRAPEEKEADIMLDHNYDGIRELDNHLPPWWKWLFYITIVFGVIYLLGHHVFDWFPLQEQEYATEMEEAKAAKLANQEASGEEVFDMASLVYDGNAEYIAAGKKIFSRNCFTCHGVNGEGGAGPNLTDEYWLHGGGIKNIFNTVTNGVPNTAMISWKSQLAPTDVRDVANFVMSLAGTNPPNAKSPQGTIWKEGESAEAAPAEEPAPTEEVAMAEDTATKTEGGNTEGKNIFESTCSPCHQPDGGGVMGLGPNLTDKYWKNGNGTKEAIHKIVSGGVAGTAMVAWSTSLSEDQINAVVDYVMSLQGTTPANPKEPEGELYE